MVRPAARRGLRRRGAFWPLVLAGALADESQGWRVVYRWLALIVPAGLLPLSMLLRRRMPAAAMAEANSVSAANAAEADLSPRLLMWLLSIASVGCCVAMAMPQIHLVSLAKDLGFGSATGSRMLSVLLIGGITSRLTSGFIADRLGGAKTLLLGSTMQCLGLVLYLVYLEEGSHNEAPLFLVSLMFGLSQGGIIPSYAIVLREFCPASEAGARVGFVVGASIVGMALGGWMAGWFHDMATGDGHATGESIASAYRWAFVNSIGWNLLNIGIVISLLCRQSRATTAPSELGNDDEAAAAAAKP